MQNQPMSKQQKTKRQRPTKQIVWKYNVRAISHSCNYIVGKTTFVMISLGQGKKNLWYVALRVRTEFVKIDSDRSTNPTQLLLVFGQNQVFWSKTKFCFKHSCNRNTYFLVSTLVITCYSLAVKSSTSKHEYSVEYLNFNVAIKPQLSGGN